MAVSQINSNSLATGVPSSANMPAGSVLQVVQTSNAVGITTNSTSFIAILNASITPKFATSKILVIGTVAVDTLSNGEQAYISILRNSSNVTVANGLGNIFGANSRVIGMLSTNYLDSPATTSSITYSLAGRSNGTNVVYFQGDSPGYLTLMEIAA
jgi:hypothetical protein